MDAKIRVTTSMPRLKDLNKHLAEIAEKMIIPTIEEHILKRKDIDGKKYDPLDPKTVRMKGHNRPLIGKKRKLLSSFKVKKKSNSVIIDLKGDRADVGKYLQIDGVKSKRYGLRKFKFFGVNVKTEKRALNFMFLKIKKLIQQARTKTRILKSLKGA